jgi:uncharacterized protein (DUF2132 family)
MENLKSKDPLHGITLKKIVEQLVAGLTLWGTH